VDPKGMAAWAVGLGGAAGQAGNREGESVAVVQGAVMVAVAKVAAEAAVMVVAVRVAAEVVARVAVARVAE